MVDVISQFLTSGSKLTDAIELFGTDFELANISIATILVTLLTAAVCGAVIYLVYRFFNRSVIYNENFNILVILTTIVTSFIIMTISSNVVLSLGMVGALSIVRFRTAIKDPMDTVFMFWSIVIGIITGAGYITVAILAALLLGTLFLALNLLSGKLHTNSYLVVMRYTPEGESAVRSKLGTLGKYKLKSRTMNLAETELVVEAKLSQKQMDSLEALLDNEGVSDVNIVSYNGSTLL